MKKYNAQLIAKVHGLPVPIAELQFAKHIGRKWRFDFAWEEEMVALEIDGAIWTNGRHTRGAGFIKDREKCNWATAMGWRVIHANPQNHLKNEIGQLINMAMKANAAIRGD